METSWHESFADRYAEWSASRTADLPFYAGLAREADGPVVELAVGSGRVAIPVCGDAALPRRLSPRIGCAG